MAFDLSEIVIKHSRLERRMNRHVGGGGKLRERERERVGCSSISAALCTYVISRCDVNSREREFWLSMAVAFCSVERN